MSQQFVHLRLHSEFSLVDGLIRIPELIKELPKRGMIAVALTDYCNLFAVVKFYQAAIAGGVKPIIGCEISCVDNGIHTPLVLLCQNEDGYRQLTQLVSKAYQEGQEQGAPCVLSSWVSEHATGLIALSGGRLGDIGQALLVGDNTCALSRATFWANMFPGRFYLEIQRTGHKDELLYNERLVKLADELNLPLVATNAVCFLDYSDYTAHVARVCIREGVTIADTRRENKHVASQFLRSADEMMALFHDLPQAIQNTVEISKRCTVMLTLGQPSLPQFATPQGESVEEYLSKLSCAGLDERISKQQLPKDNYAIYRTRLETELSVINAMGFAGYFLIVADFIQWAQQQDIPVGPGRGSGAGSLVAYVLKITDLDPLQYDLLFERFLNPERVSMPDFDIDFCMEGRDRVIEYVAQKYGRHSVSQIITFGTMAAKAAVRDVGRVLGHPYGFVDEIAKLIPFELGITLPDALQKEPILAQRYASEEEVKELVDLAISLEGIARNAGKHAGGVVIAPSKLTDFTAIYCEKDSTQWVSQFDKDDVEAVGLVKFDFLGLKTLTIIHWALLTINQSRAQPLNISEIPLDDIATFKLLDQGKTTAVFQLESRGMKELINRLQPDCFEEIIALVALFRPGPLQSGMVDDFIDRKHGRAKVEYLHPDLETILKPTYGVILYQEQVMQIAQVLANYTLGAADLLRRAMGKKKPEEMAQQREIFTQGASLRGIDKETATIIFDLMEKFAGYGFNKSHSAAYALIAYQTAWLKTHYVAAFMAAVISADMDNTEKVVGFLHECGQLKLTVLPPTINQAQWHFTVIDASTILYGLGAIKGVGEAAIAGLVQERTNGHYIDLLDLCKRIDLRKLNKRVLETLIKSGCMDVWGMDRAVLLASLDTAIQLGAKTQQQLQSGQGDLFSDAFAAEVLFACNIPTLPEKQRLDFEKETLGLYLTGHPVTAYLREWQGLIQPLAQLPSVHKKHVITCGLILSIRKMMTKSAKKIVILTLEDANAQFDIVMFDNVFLEYNSLLATGQICIIEGDLRQDTYKGGVKMTATSCYSVAQARAKFAKCMYIKISEDNHVDTNLLKNILLQHPGGCLIQISYRNARACAKISVSTKFAVSADDELLLKLSNILGEGSVGMSY